MVVDFAVGNLDSGHTTVDCIVGHRILELVRDTRLAPDLAMAAEVVDANIVADRTLQALATDIQYLLQALAVEGTQVAVKTDMAALTPVELKRRQRPVLKPEA